MFLTVSAPTVLVCSECGTGHFLQFGPDDAMCGECGSEVTPSLDIARNLEWNERMVWVTDSARPGYQVLAYFTEEEHEEEGIDY